jgi:predicted O-methyltransferase YrrM
VLSERRATTARSDNRVFLFPAVGDDAFVSATLSSVEVRRVLARLQAEGAARDEEAKERVRAREAQLGQRVYGHERADLYGNAHLSITPQVGDLLYVLATAQQATTIVEFGASRGFSTIYLTAALRDIGAGSIISTEFQPEKARQARANLAEAGLSHLVELREGDAFETLRDLDRPVDLLFRDGWNDLYLSVLKLVEPKLRPGSLVVADLSKDDPHLIGYCEYVWDPPYRSVEVPHDAGVVLSVRLK